MMERNVVTVYCASERLKEVCDAVIRDYMIEYPKENVVLKHLLGLLPSNESLRAYMVGFYIGDYLMVDLMLKVLVFYKDTGRDFADLMGYAKYNAENSKPLDEKRLSKLALVGAIEKVDEINLNNDEKKALRGLKNIFGDNGLMQNMFCSKDFNVYSLLGDVRDVVDMYAVLRELFKLQEWRDTSETRMKLIELLKKI